MIRGFDPIQNRNGPALQLALGRYAEILRPWAELTSRKVAVALNHQDASLWRRQTKEMSLSLRQRLQNAEVSEEISRFIQDNTHLITSLPKEAAEKVQELTVEHTFSSERSDELARRIYDTGLATEARATLIARTETARTANELTRIRAQAIGVEQFVWRTSRDADVRPDHRKLEGKVFDFDKPPVADRKTGAHALPGGIYNCRCWAEPVVTDLE